MSHNEICWKTLFAFVAEHKSNVEMLLDAIIIIISIKDIYIVPFRHAPKALCKKKVVLKRAAFKRARNVSNVTSSHRRAAGKLFPTAGPETEKLLSP